MKRRDDYCGIPPEPVHALIYLRVSGNKQRDSGVGEEMQLQRCRAMLAFRGWEERGVFRDLAISGVEEFEDRPGLMAAISKYQEYERGTCVLVAYDLKRFARRSRLAMNLIDVTGPYGGVQIATTREMFDTSTPHGRFYLQMHAAMAELDWEDIREKNIAMQAAARARGSRIGREKMITPETEQLVRDLYSTGEYSHKSLANHLNQSRVPSPAGGRWHDRTIRRVLAGK